MKARWQALALRINALSLRERGILFVALLACLIALADSLFLTPALKQYQAVQQSFATQNAEITRLRSELQAAGTPLDRNQQMREGIVQAEADIARIDQAIQDQLKKAVSGRALEPVLVEFLRRYNNLTLLGTNTVKEDAASAKTQPAVQGLRRQGLELRIAGPYKELLRFAQSLEAALPYLRWESVRIKAEQQPAEMALRVYVWEVLP